MPRVVLLALLALLVAPPAAATHGDVPVDVHVHLSASGAASVTGEGVTLLNETAGEEARFALNLTQEYTTLDVRVDGWSLQRPRQVLPLLHVDAREPVCAKGTGTCEYPLFERFPNERVWDVDGAGRVFHTNGTAASVVLRLGVPGPVNATLVLVRDVTPPTYTIRPPQNVTTIGFYQESVTGELALADLQIRAVGATEWIQNPTPVYHVLQRFPVQGLDADTEYEERFVFTDWSENTITTRTYPVRTSPEPERPGVVVTPVSPEPNATVGREGIVVRATWASPDSPVQKEGVRIFFDKREVTPDAGFAASEVAYAVPGVLERGLHSVSVEVTNEAGGRGIARWTFEAGTSEVPLAPWAALAGLLAAATLLRRRG